MMDAILFDLDGTLLGLDALTFVPRYFQSILESIGPDFPDFQVTSRLTQGVRGMLTPRQDGKTNQEAFSEVFFEDIPDDRRETLMAAFRAYYQDVFPRLKAHSAPLPGAVEAVEEARRHTRALVVATNPLFPKEATRERLLWAGLDPCLFDLVTTYETSHHVKPDPRYYQSILNTVEATAERTWMFGNDRMEDGAAKEVGIPFYYVTGPYAIERDGPPPDRQGALKDVLQFLKTL